MRLSKSLAVSALTATMAVTTAVLPSAPTAVAAVQPDSLAAANAAIDANLGSLNQQAAELNGQVAEVSGVITKLEAERAALIPEKAQKENVVRETAKQAYMAGAPSGVEVLASNQTLSGTASTQQYRDKLGEKSQAAVKDLKETESKIAANLDEATKKRDGLVAMQSDMNEKLETAQAQAEAKRALAEATQNKEEEYQKLRQRQQQESLAVAAASPTAPASSAPSSAPSAKPSPGSGGGMVRGNNPYTPGQCTWYVYNQTGRGQMGNAGQWPGGGAKAVGSILIMPPGVGGAGGVGHVGVIVGISGSGITIRDMNWAGPFVVTTHTVPNSGSYRYL